MKYSKYMQEFMNPLIEEILSIFPTTRLTYWDDIHVRIDIDLSRKYILYLSLEDAEIIFSRHMIKATACILSRYDWGYDHEYDNVSKIKELFYNWLTPSETTKALKDIIELFKEV